MGLEDKFYPNSKSPLTQFDNLMIRTTGLVGEVYQQLTGNSYKTLIDKTTKISYYGNVVAALALNFLAIHQMSLIKGKKIIYESPIQEEIRNEISGDPKSLDKGLRVAMLALESFVYCLAIDSIDDPGLFNKILCSSFILSSISTVPYIMCDYMSKSDIPKPPPKSVFSKLTVSLFNGKPAPVIIDK
jgi:hypothetical protein